MSEINDIYPYLTERDRPIAQIVVTIFSACVKTQPVWFALSGDFKLRIGIIFIFVDWAMGRRNRAKALLTNIQTDGK